MDHDENDEAESTSDPPQDRERRCAIVTGATSGIGAAFAERLASDGYDLLVTGRREALITRKARSWQRKYGITVEVVLADFTIAADLGRLIERISSRSRVEIIVNNAGFGTKTPFFTDTFENQERMLKVHINATTRLTHAVVPLLETNGCGYIVNVSSLGAFTPSPVSPFYAATKAFLNTFSEAIAIELRPKRIRVQALCPGFTRTDFHEKMEMERSSLRNRGLVRWMRPEAVVAESLKALRRENGRVIVIPGLANRIVYRLLRLIPRRLYYRGARRSSIGRKAEDQHGDEANQTDQD